MKATKKCLHCFAVGLLLMLQANSLFAHFGAKFEPADGQIYTGLGQNDTASIMQAVNANGAANKPVIIAVYNPLVSPVFVPNQNLMQAHNFYPGCKLNLGILLPQNSSAELKKVFDGTYDEAIHALATALKALGPQDIFLRFAFEIDGPWRGYDPALVVQAWQYLVTFLDKEGVTNVAYVWNVSEPDQNPFGDIFAWYPGDAFVDWFAFNTWTPFDATWFMQQANAHGKPVMICESTRRYASDTFADWINGYFADVEAYGIKGYQYINWDWDSYPQWASSWDNGMFTDQGQSIIDLYNSKIQQSFYLKRGVSHHDPMMLAVAASRGIVDHVNNPPGTPWDKSLDEYAAKSGYDYAIVDGLHDYGASGTLKRWTNLPETKELAIDVTVPTGSRGLVYLRASSPGLAHAVRIGGREPVSRAFEQNHKLEYYSTDIVNGVLRVSVNTDLDTPIYIEELVVQSYASSALSAPASFTAVRTTDAVALSWQAVSGAEMYNVYCNGSLITTTTDLSYNHARDFYQESIYTVSAWNQYAGEGYMTNPISYGQYQLQAEHCQDSSGLTVSSTILSYVSNGAWAKYGSIGFGGAGLSGISVRASSLNGGSILVRQDSPTGPLIGTIAIPAGSWGTYGVETASLASSSGNHDVYLVFSGSGAFVCNLDWVRFETPIFPYQAFSALEMDGSSGITAGSDSITSAMSGSWVRYSDLTFLEPGTGRLELYANSLSGCTVEARLGSPAGTLIGTVNVPAEVTGKFTTISDDIARISGTEDIHLVFSGSGAGEIKWIRFLRTVPRDAFEDFAALEPDDHSNLLIGPTNLYNVQPGAWARYSDVDFGDDGAATVQMNLSSAVGGAVEVRLGSPTGTLLGSVTVPAGSWSSYALHSAELSGAVGLHDVYLVFSGSGTYVCNLKEAGFVPFGSNPFQKIEAESLNGSAGLSVGGTFLYNVTPGAWAKFADLEFGDRGPGYIEARLSSQPGGVVEVRLDSQTGPLLGSLTVPPGAWGTYSTIGTALTTTGAQGLHDVYLAFTGSGSYVCNLDWIEFAEAVDPYALIEANQTDEYFGLTVGDVLYNAEDGAWARFSNVDFGSASTAFLVLFASSQNGGTVEARLDSPTGTLLGAVVVPSGAWGEYQVEVNGLTGATGVHDLYLVFHGAGAYTVNLDWLKLIHDY